MIFFVRVFFLTILRFFVLMSFLLFLQNFDVSPLPAWTLIATAYLAHFLLTWFFAAWAFHKQYPSNSDIAIAGGSFLIIGTLLEAGLYFILSPGATFQGLLKNYSWQSLILVAIYIAAIALAAYRARKKREKLLPEGVVM